MDCIDLGGEYKVRLCDGSEYSAMLPGTLDTNGIGAPENSAKKWHPDAAIDETGTFTECGCILTRLTRKHTYEGSAVFSRRIDLSLKEGERLFVEAERARELSLRWNGMQVPHYTQGTISTPHVFEITQFVCEGENTVEFISDNSYPHWTHDPIVFSSAATDETQTNWNGLIGYLRIRRERPDFICSLRIYPAQKSVDVQITLDCAQAAEKQLTLESEAFGTVARTVRCRQGVNTIWMRKIPLVQDVRYWDEGEGNLYEAAVRLNESEIKRAVFGLRTVGSKNGRLTINGRTVFLRCEANSALFPETGHWPMDVESWRSIMRKYRSYGANCVRFHSHCPPEAAFEAADELGIFMQPELSHWNPRTAFERDEDYAYYRMELTELLLHYANHPSFITLSFGNELAAESKGHKRMQLLLRHAKKLDKTRLIASGSNNHYGWFGPDLTDDFYAATNLYEYELRATFAGMGGYLNRDYPSTQHNFDDTMRHVREEFDGPVLQFEVGQYEVLPDFDELALFHGVTRPDNLTHVKERVEALGLAAEWKRRVEATGELSLLCYREEVEACLRTPGLSGISLLSLQDFTGQGTALVGMMNSHFEQKPFSFAEPSRFAAFFRSVIPLALFDRYTYYEGEIFSFRMKFANYGNAEVSAAAQAVLYDGAGNIVGSVCSEEQTFPCGKLSAVKGAMRIRLPEKTEAQKLTLHISIGAYENNYSVWVYPKKGWQAPEGVTVARSFSDAMAALQEGGTVILDPIADEKHLPGTVKAQFSTDFWSVGTFPSQSGFMGVLVDETHPVFKKFPTQFHSDWQWWQLTSKRAFILPEGMKSLITGMDCYARLRNLSLLFEAKVGKGRLIASSMGLLDNSCLPEVNAMLASLCDYASSEMFAPTQELTEEALRALIV